MSFELGKFEVLTEGRDLMIISAGYMLHECNKTLDVLDKAGIDASLVDLYSLPFDNEALLDLANANGGNILTVEDNYGGGIGSAVADAVTESGDAFTIEQLRVRRIPGSARDEEGILTQSGLHHSIISKRAAGMLGVQTVCNFFIPSGSGQAYVTMPIMSPLATLTGVPQHLARYTRPPRTRRRLPTSTTASERTSGRS